MSLTEVVHTDVRNSHFKFLKHLFNQSGDITIFVSKRFVIYIMCIVCACDKFIRLDPIQSFFQFGPYQQIRSSHFLQKNYRKESKMAENYQFFPGRFRSFVKGLGQGEGQVDLRSNPDSFSLNVFSHTFNKENPSSLGVTNVLAENFFITFR